MSAPGPPDPRRRPTWQHPERDQELRLGLIERIIQLLKERKRNPTEDWINKLPDMAKKLEDRLYHYSASREDYENQTTLTQRLQHIALEITKDREQKRDTGLTLGTPGPAGNMNMPMQMPNNMNMHVNSNMPMNAQQHMMMRQGQMPGQPVQGSAPTQMPGLPNPNNMNANLVQNPNNIAGGPGNPNSRQRYPSINSGSNNPATQNQMSQQQFQRMRQGQVPPPVGQLPVPNQAQARMNFPNQNGNMNPQGQPQNFNMRPNSVTPTWQHQQMQMQMQQNMQRPPNAPGSVGGPSQSPINMNVNPRGGQNQNQMQMNMNQARNAQIQQQQMMQQRGPVPMPPTANGNGNPSAPAPVSGSVIGPRGVPMPNQNQLMLPPSINQSQLPPGAAMDPNARQREHVLRQQQKRLLLLRHASKCTFPEGRCTATQECEVYKQLWVHIVGCKNQRCDTPHCVSSRYVLSHYHRCQEETCPVCAPVREAIDRHNQSIINQPRRQGGNNDIPQISMTPANGNSIARGTPNQMAAVSRASDSPQPGSLGIPMRSPSVGSHAHSAGTMNMQMLGGMPQGMYRDPSHMSIGPPPALPGTPMQGNGNPNDEVQRQLAELQRQEQELEEKRRREELDRERIRQQIEHLKNLQANNVSTPSASSMPNQIGQIPVNTSVNNPGRQNQSAQQRPIPVNQQNQTQSQRRPATSMDPTPNAQPNKRSRGGAMNLMPGNEPNVMSAAVIPPNQSQMLGMNMPIHPQAIPLPNAIIQVPHSHPNAMGMHTGQVQGPPTSALSAEEIARARDADARLKMAQMLKVMQGQSSLIYTFNVKQIEQHVKSLTTTFGGLSYAKLADLRNRASNLLKILLELDYAWIYNKPVDPVQLEIPDYFNVIKKPMDLGTVKKNVEMNYYKSFKQFANDVRLVFNNAMIYNPENSDVHNIARQYGFRFEKEYNTMMKQMREEEALKRCNDNACKLCGGEKYTFEPPVYYCNGKCNQKIRRSAFFYMTPDNKQFYCLSCYNTCVKDQVLLEDGATIPKSQMIKKKNDELQEESWVECTMCKRWYHQICVLFNGRNDQSRNEPYYCPFCVLKFLDMNRKEQIPQPKEAKFGAIDLPVTGYSQFLEMRVRRRIDLERNNKAKENGSVPSEVERCGKVYVRVVSSKEVELFPRAGLERLYGESDGYTKSFPHKVKCVLLFQEIDGVDVLILSLYTQVYGSDCPMPNSRTLYIAYLDSVHYFYPAFCRTPVYHELLESTLEYEKRRGITKTFIWVCPPLAGDDYILYCHPKEQKTPKADMLRNWYYKLLENCRKRGIIVSMDNLYDAYFQRVCNVASVPHFDGDYWPGVSEQFIEQLETEKIDPKSIAPRKKRSYSRNRHVENKSKSSKSKSKQSKMKGNGSSSKSKKKSSTAKRSSSRNTSSGNLIQFQNSRKIDDSDDDMNDDDTLHEVELTAEHFLPPKPVATLEIPQQDALTVKIGDVIHQLRDDFMVVYMHHICAGCCDNIDKPHQVFWLPEKYDPAGYSLDFIKNRYAPPFALCDACYRSRYQDEFGSNAEPNYDDIQIEPTGDHDEDYDTIGGLGQGKSSEAEMVKNINEAVKLKLDEMLNAIEGSNCDLDEEEDGLFLKREDQEHEEEDKVMEVGADIKLDGDDADVIPDPPLPLTAAENENEDECAQDGDEDDNCKGKEDILVPSTSPIIEEEPDEAATNGIKLEDGPHGIHVKLEAESPGLGSSISPKNGSQSQNDDMVTVLPPGQIAARRSAWFDAPCSLLQMKPFRTNIPEETIDTDPLMDCQFFDSRQQFLSLCQGNRYQFDQLRRTKHSSMMVLYHLHNPEMPSFIHSCNNCRMDIASGTRFSCKECEDFDLCEACYGRVSHHHQLHPIIDNASVGIGMKGPQMAMQQQMTMNMQQGGDRTQSHVALLFHASNCKAEDCENKNCFRMKRLLHHGAHCNLKVVGGCKICRRIWGLLTLHARQCRVRGHCNVPSCNRVRSHMQRLMSRQQDRRIRMQTKRMQEERMQAQQIQMGGSPSHGEPRSLQYGASSPTNVEMQRNAKQGKNIK